MSHRIGRNHWSRNSLSGTAMTDSIPKDSAESFEQVILAHKIWLDSFGTDGRQAIFDGKDLSGQGFAGVDLRYARMRKADVSGADLSNSDLSGADLRGATLRMANLYGARLDRADLTDAHVRISDIRRCSITGIRTNQFSLIIFLKFLTILGTSGADEVLRGPNDKFKRVTLGLLGVFSLFLVLYTFNKGLLLGDVGLDSLRAASQSETAASSSFFMSMSFVYSFLLMAMVISVGYLYAFTGTWRFVQTQGIHRDIRSETALGQRYRTQADAIEEKLRQADIDDEQHVLLVRELKEHESRLSQFVRENAEREALDEQVTRTVEALKSSLQTSDELRASLATSATFFRLAGAVSFMMAASWLGYMGFLLQFAQTPESSLLWRAIFADKWGGVIALFTFPVTIFLVVGVALLRHEGKLLQEVRGYTQFRLQIDTMSGLLNAARHAEVGDGRRPLIRDSFLKIRDALLIGNSERQSEKDSPSSSRMEDAEGVPQILALLKDLVGQKR